MAICEARTVGLWYGSTWPSVRKLIGASAAAQVAQSANGFAEIGELREEEVLDRRVRVVAQPVGVDDLLDDLLVERAAGFPGQCWISE